MRPGDRLGGRRLPALWGDVLPRLPIADAGNGHALPGLRNGVGMVLQPLRRAGPPGGGDLPVLPRPPSPSPLRPVRDDDAAG